MVTDSFLDVTACVCSVQAEKEIFNLSYSKSKWRHRQAKTEEVFALEFTICYLFASSDHCGKISLQERPGYEKTSKSGWCVRQSEQEELTKKEKNLLRLISLAGFISEGEVEDEIWWVLILIL